MKPHLRSKSRRLSTANGLFLALVPFALILEVATHSLGKWLDSMYPEQWIGISFLLFAVVAIIGVYLWLLLIAPRINRLSAATAIEIVPADYPEFTYLITGYSPIQNGPAEFADEAQIKALCTAFREKCTDLKCACDKETAGNIRLPWQQNLRVINEANAGGLLKTVYVIEPAMSQSEFFIGFIKHYFPDLTVERVTMRHKPDVAYHHRTLGNDVRDYENFDYVAGAFKRALEMAAENENAELTDIEPRVAIDVTPGLKIFSVAAAIQSLNAGVVFFYAKTRSDAGKVIAYDASVNITASPA